MGSYAVARFLPDHDFEPLAPHSCCAVCGQYTRDGEPQDMNVLNFEAVQVGGVRRDDIAYVAFDLEQFALDDGLSCCASSAAIAASRVHSRAAIAAWCLASAR